MKKLSILLSSVGKNKDLAEKIASEAKNRFEVKVHNLVEYNLPLYSTIEEEKEIPEKAFDLAKDLIAASALLVIAPEYNGSIPPVLNNSVAWVSRTGEDWRGAFNRKPTVLATHSGGGGTKVLMAMQQQFSHLGANVIGRQLLTSYSKELNIDSLKDCLDQLRKYST